MNFLLCSFYKCRSRTDTTHQLQIDRHRETEMAGFVFPEVMRTMSSGDWVNNTEVSEAADKTIADLQEQGILDENKGYTQEIETHEDDIQEEQDKAGRSKSSAT